MNLCRALRTLLLLLIVSSGARAAVFNAAEPAGAPATIESAYHTPNSVTVYWSAPRAGPAADYQVFRDNHLIATPGIQDRSFTDSNLEPGRSYAYRVEADVAGARTSSHTVHEKLPPAYSPVVTTDLVVAGASSAGIAAAVTAARAGYHVALLEETDRLGGIMSNGLCSTDIRRPEHATGFFSEFSSRIKQYYGGGDGLRYEPHVVNNVFKDLVAAEPRIDVYYHMRITGARTRGDTVIGVDAVSLDSHKRSFFRAPITIDAEPSGDVAASAGCLCRVGREPRTAEEPHAGVIYYSRAQDILLPGSTGRGDRRLMSYAYLLLVKDYGPGTNHTIPRPPGYRVEDYIHTPAWKQSWAVTSGAMPGGKYELNQHPQGNDLQEINYDWPQASPARRAEIEQQYRDHALGYLYYLQTTLGLPNLGLPDDEFPENGGFPETLYVREARRIVGLANLTESDVSDADARLRPDAGGIGDYPMDSHAVEVKTDWSTPDNGEGEFWLYRQTPWYQIPFGVVIPRGRNGILVAEAVSATHVGYGTLRMEATRMETGELCAILSGISLNTGLPLRAISPGMAQDHLAQTGQALYWHADHSNGDRHGPAVEYLSAHGFWTGAKFDPAGPVSRREAAETLERLQWMEAVQSGDSVLSARLKSVRWHVPERPDDPITRAELAGWLLQCQCALAPWWQYTPADSGAEGYADAPGSALPDAARILWHHHLGVESWINTRFDRTGRPFFEGDHPVARVDLAEWIFLAQRGFPTPLFHVIEPVVAFTPQPRS